MLTSALDVNRFGYDFAGSATDASRRNYAMDARPERFLPLVSHSLGRDCYARRCLLLEKHPANAKRAWRCNAPSIGRCLATRLAARHRLRDWLRRRVLTSRLGMPALKQGYSPRASLRFRASRCRLRWLWQCARRAARVV